MNLPLDWLLEGDPWVVYRTRVDLLGEPQQADAVVAARQAMLDHPLMQPLLADLAGWPGIAIASHKSAGQNFHKLTFLADVGFRADDTAMQPILTRVFEYQADDGPFQLSMNVPTHFGGSGEEQRAWALCDAPLVVYALGKMGLGEDARVRKSRLALTGLVRENGWPCAVSPELGDFRGPGRKQDPCPFANLGMLKALSQSPEALDSPASRIGCETLLNLWQNSWEQHPYIFYMGNDFRKLKAPFIWYDLLHVLDVLSHFPWVRQDNRFLDMLHVLASKADAEGRFTPESVWTAWKDWEFGQKKTPSRWMTFLAWRILHRVEEN